MKFMPAGYFQLHLDKVNPCNHLSDWMLHLKSRVHLHKEELVGLGVQDKFNSTRIEVSHSFCSLDSCLSNLSSNLLSNLTRGFLDNLLMESLDWAVSFIEIDVVSVFVSNDLDFYVSGLCNILLNNHVVVIERVFGFLFGSFQLVLEFFLVFNNSHSSAATSHRRLYDHWITNLVSLLF